MFLCLEFFQNLLFWGLKIITLDLEFVTYLGVLIKTNMVTILERVVPKSHALAFIAF